MIKKILIILFVLIVLAGGALAYFIATFDAETYKPIVEEKLTEAVGNPVSLGDISLTWNGGVALSLQELTIYEDNKPAFELVGADANLRILPLLQKSVEVGSIKIIEPKMTLIRGKNGLVTIAGVNPSPANAAKKGSNGKEAVALPFLVNTIQLKDAEVYFMDEMTSPRTEIKIHQLSIELKNVSLIRPMDVEGELAIFSGSPNIFLKTKVYPPRPGKAAALKNLNLEANLESIRLGELINSYPPARQWGLMDRLGGKLKVEADKIDLSESPLDTLKAYIQFNEGYVKHISVADPIQNITLKANVIEKQANVEKFQALWADSKLNITGKVFNLDNNPSGQVQGTLQNFDLEKLATNLPPNDPHLKGMLNAEFEGQVDGFEEVAILTSLTGQGHIKIDQLTLANINILNEVLSRLSMIPGLKEKLESRLSEEYKEKLKTRDTNFEPIDLKVKATRGVLQFDEVKLATDAFDLNGTAKVALSGSVSSRLMLSMDPEISDAMFRSVEELRYLADANGRLQLPIQISGQAPRILVLPDLGYVTSKLAASKVQDLIGGFLNKKSSQPEQTNNTDNAASPSDPQAAQNQATSGGQATQQDPLGSLLGGLLQQAIEKNT